MSRIVFAVVAVAFATPAVSAAPVAADEGKASGFPYSAKAPVVVCLNGYDKARERITKLLTAALPNEAPKLTKRFDEQLEKVLEGRKLTAIRKDARIYLVLNDLKGLLGDDEPPIAAIVPVTAYKDFRESFLTKEELKTLDQGRDGVDAIKTEAFGDEMPVFMVDLKDHVVVTIDRATADV